MWSNVCCDIWQWCFCVCLQEGMACRRLLRLSDWNAASGSIMKLEVYPQNKRKSSLVGSFFTMTDGVTEDEELIVISVPENSSLLSVFPMITFFFSFSWCHRDLPSFVLCKDDFNINLKFLFFSRSSNGCTCKLTFSGWEIVTKLNNYIQSDEEKCIFE